MWNFWQKVLEANGVCTLQIAENYQGTGHMIDRCDSRIWRCSGGFPVSEAEAGVSGQLYWRPQISNGRRCSSGKGCETQDLTEWRAGFWKCFLPIIRKEHSNQVLSLITRKNMDAFIAVLSSVYTCIITSAVFSQDGFTATFVHCHQINLQGPTSYPCGQYTRQPSLAFPAKLTWDAASPGWHQLGHRWPSDGRLSGSRSYGRQTSRPLCGWRPQS